LLRIEAWHVVVPLLRNVYEFVERNGKSLSEAERAIRNLRLLEANFSNRNVGGWTR